MTISNFNSTIEALKNTAPLSISLNIITCVVLLIVGLYLLRKKQTQTKGKRIGGRICLLISALAALGAIINLILFYVIF